jgi:hypothetical protein
MCQREWVGGWVNTSLRCLRDNEYEEGKLATFITGNPRGRHENLKLPLSYLHESVQECYMSLLSTVPRELLSLLDFSIYMPTISNV